jgi:hypothetical protein
MAGGVFLTLHHNETDSPSFSCKVPDTYSGHTCNLKIGPCSPSFGQGHDSAYHTAEKFRNLKTKRKCPYHKIMGKERRGVYLPFSSF